MSTPTPTPKPPKDVLCSLNPRVNSAPAAGTAPASPVTPPAKTAPAPTLDQVEKTLETLYKPGSNSPA